MQSELGGEDTLVWFSLDNVVLEHGENNLRLVGEVCLCFFDVIENFFSRELYC
jgi:hypothetical protein